MPELSIKVMKELMEYGPYYFEVTNGVNLSAAIQYDTTPEVQPLTDFKVKVHFRNHRPDPYRMELGVFLPEGWTAEYQRSVYLEHGSLNTHKRASWEMTIHVGERVEAVNKVCVWVNAATHPLPLMIPMVLMG